MSDAVRSLTTTLDPTRGHMVADRKTVTFEANADVVGEEWIDDTVPRKAVFVERITYDCNVHGHSMPANGLIGLLIEGSETDKGTANHYPFVVTVGGIEIFKLSATNGAAAAYARVQGNLQVSGTATVAGTTIGLTNPAGCSIGTAAQKLSFYAAPPVAKQTGVAVTAAAIHAALVTLGLIAP